MADNYVYAYNDLYETYLKLPIPAVFPRAFSNSNTYSVMGTDLYDFNFKKMQVAKFSLNLATSSMEWKETLSIPELSLKSQIYYGFASDLTTKRIYRTGGSFASERYQFTRESTGETIAIDLS